MVVGASHVFPHKPPTSPSIGPQRFIGSAQGIVWANHLEAMFRKANRASQSGRQLQEGPIRRREAASWNYEGCFQVLHKAELERFPNGN